MSRITYEGEGAGLGKKLANGDRNSPHNYMLTCTCEAILGPLGRFAPNKSGERSALCPKCQHVTIINGQGQILKVVHVSCVLAPNIQGARES
jgi:hypothetical protein